MIYDFAFKASSAYCLAIYTEDVCTGGRLKAYCRSNFILAFLHVEQLLFILLKLDNGIFPYAEHAIKVISLWKLSKFTFYQTQLNLIKPLYLFWLFTTILVIQMRT